MDEDGCGALEDELGAWLLGELKVMVEWMRTVMEHLKMSLIQWVPG